MSASTKFDLSSGNPNRPLYESGHRGSYGAASLGGSGSFCENMEDSLFSSPPNMTGSSSSVTPGDVLNFFQCLRFDPKSMVVEHKLNRAAEFKRLASAAVGIPLEDSLPASSKSKQLSSTSLEDLRRLKSGARESGTKARERVKIFNDCLSVLNKCFPTIPSRKRSRLDALSNDRSNTLLSIDRCDSGMAIGKMGSQNHASKSGLPLEQHKSEQRTKNAIPSKRTRTSMVNARMDVRANAVARPAGNMDKERDLIRFPNSGAVQGEDRTFSIAIDGWENSKMKKKRTGVKPDAAASSVTTKPADGYREAKQGMQPRLSAEARSRLNDSHGFRSGIANGGVGGAKVEATSQTSSGIRLSISRTDTDKSSLLRERRERPSGQEKERANLKSVNKANSREDFSLGGPTSGSKLNVNACAPRSGSVGSVSKLSQVVQRSSSSNDCNLSSCTNKFPGVLGASNHKYTPSTQSSFPPVANWVQGPQKISRTASRTNLLPIIPGNDDNPAADVTPDMMVNERCFPANSPQQVKIKSNSFSPAALSESEESGATEIKLRDQNKKGNENEERSGHNVQKMSTLLLPPRKNEAVSGDEHGDGVRRQGRTGWGFTSHRSLLPLAVEKLGNMGTTKQIRSSRLGLDKTERAGRPSTRKLSDRKAYTRQKHITINMSADFLVGSDDGCEELLVAANAVTNTAQALSSSFWKKMELLFHLVSDADISYLKDQVTLGSAVDTSALALLDADRSTFVPNGCGLNELGREEMDTRKVELSAEHSAPGAKTLNGISLYQRLIAALIPEEGDQELAFGEKDVKYNLYGSQIDVEKDMESETLFSPMSRGSDISGYPTSDGYGVNTSGLSFNELDHTMQDDLLSDQLISGTECSGYQYQNMSMNERVLTEVHSIGIYPDLMSDLSKSGDEEISGDICRLDEKYQEQVLRKKCLLGKLLNSASEAKELQEKEFERCALDKLLGVAYEKYMSCWGPNAHGMKSASGKMAKQAAFAFVKWALEHYQEFEAKGNSCFNEPLYGEIFLSGVSRFLDGTPLSSAPVDKQQSPSSNQDTYYSEVLESANLGSEPNTGKEDSWSNRAKRRELLLDDVGGTTSSSPGFPSGLGGSLSCSAKGKRSERDREGKENGREVMSRSGNTKIGRPASVTVKGERKSKAKPKRKTANLSASVSGPLGKMSNLPKEMLPSTINSCDISGSEIVKDKNDYNLDLVEEPIDLSGLQLPEMDDLGVPSNPGGQGEDIGSWLNIDEDGLQDHDYTSGLEIPMDNLADLNMMV